MTTKPNSGCKTPTATRMQKMSSNGNYTITKGCDVFGSDLQTVPLHPTLHKDLLVSRGHGKRVPQRLLCRTEPPFTPREHPAVARRFSAGCSFLFRKIIHPPLQLGYPLVIGFVMDEELLDPWPDEQTYQNIEEKY